MSLQDLGISFILGIIATASPCVYPLYPGFLAYLAGSSQRLRGRGGTSVLGFFVLLGVLTTMLLLGLVIALAGLAAGRVLVFVTPAADLALVLLGVLLLLGKNPFSRIPQIQGPDLASPALNAYIYGLFYGPIVLPCAAPIAVGVLALSLTAADFAGRMLLFFVFGLGFGVPLFGLSLLAGARQQWLVRQFTQHHRLMGAAAGAVLVAVGLYDLSLNLGPLSLYLG